MANNLNEKLEKLNERIDVWIDDEDYSKIWFDTKENDNAKGIITLSNNAKSKVRKCFPDDSSQCTHGKDDKWQQALSCAINSLPVVKVGGEDLKPPDKYWSHLFYAKLLRAKIKQKGSDCYTRRLDDVAAYLERHLPQQGGDDEWKTRLTLMYLLELSAVSQDWESLGFAERARRVITDAKHSQSVNTAVKKAPYEFYELWAHYNIGVAYFHQGYYRKAVLEFNRIIWQVGKWGGNTQNWTFFKNNHGVALLYLPAILYRAEVQLKLQFAYHSLDTLDKRFWKNESINIAEEERTSHKKIHSMLIEAQAYQQMGRLDESWGILDGNEDNKVKEKQEGICKLVADNVQLGQRTDCIIPERDKLNQSFPSLGERFIDILIADHLDWLTFRGEDSKQPPLKLTELVRRGDAEPDGYLQAVEDAKSYLNKLVIKAFSSYFKVVEHHAYNRSGYFQQLAKYLAWLGKAADLKTKGCPAESSANIPKAREDISKIVKDLYNYKLHDDKRIRDAILEREPGLDNKKEKEESKCQYCEPKGIDLRRIDTEHYKWFTDDMLEFFNSKIIMEVGKQQQKINLEKDKKEFVRRLISLEREARDDLRIRDLELRYKYYELDAPEFKKYSGRKLCWDKFKMKDRKDFAEFLECARQTKRSEQDPFGDPPMADIYTNIMKNWDDSFLHHLKSPSTHEYPESGFYFLGLQRWNSASPAKGFSVGGGYLLYHYNEKRKYVDVGIAIDPGFDFVRNLFHMGFSLDDIDIVLLSHAHPDHIRDFESIVMLLSELKKRGKRDKRVHVILSLGTYKRLEHIIEDPGYRYFVEPYIIDVDREINDDYFEKKMPEFSFESTDTNSENRSINRMERVKAVLSGENPGSGLSVKIKPTRAYHDDKTYSDSFGFLVELIEGMREADGEDKGKALKFGYTGDTKWVYPNMPDPVNKKDNRENNRKERIIEDIAKQYSDSDCDVLLVHLGSLIKKNDDDEWSFNQYDECGSNAGNKYRCEELVRNENHPYLVGMLRLLSSLYKNLPKVKPICMPLVLVGEFGEELRGRIRSDFIQRLQGIYKNRLAFLPVDVGMNVYLRRKGDEQDQSRSNRCACRVWCVQCNHFVNIGDADFELYGADHALYCVCKTCKKAIPLNVLQDRLRQLYEVGLELRSYENK